MVKKQPKIKSWERDRIANLLSSKVSIRQISRELGRSHSSILSEVKRNSSGDEYRAIRADDLSRARNITSRRISPLKNPVTTTSFVVVGVRKKSLED